MPCTMLLPVQGFVVHGGLLSTVGGDRGHSNWSHCSRHALVSYVYILCVRRCVVHAGLLSTDGVKLEADSKDNNRTH